MVRGLKPTEMEKVKLLAWHDEKLSQTAISRGTNGSRKWFTIFFKPCMIQKSQVYDKTKQTDQTGKL